MRLLIITQKVDKDDPILGFFHDWVLKLSEKVKEISVICLEKGKYNLPSNVKVFSLGKERKVPLFSIFKYLLARSRYVANFYRYILGLHYAYDAVFVHMNQEYVVLGGFLWKIMKKKVYLWRNHRHGNLFTRIAVWLSNKVFCTSKFAFVGRYKKTEIMPVGIDTHKFTKRDGGQRIKNSILFIGRISPIKNLNLLIDALGVLRQKRADFVCNFYGDALPKDRAFCDDLKIKAKNLGLDGKVNFYKGVSNHETPNIYHTHDIFVNLTSVGSFDKTILEAAACGCLLSVTNPSLLGEIDERLIIKGKTAEDIAQNINFLLDIDKEEKIKISEELREYVSKKHGLDVLIDKLVTQL